MQNKAATADPSPLRFSEAEIGAFYDTEDESYRQFWDADGSLHWGYFDDLANVTPGDFQRACQRWSELMLEKSGIDSESRVLDIGCGNGYTALWLSQRTGCSAFGVDIGSTRIARAQQQVAAVGSGRVQFSQAGATALPFEDGAFTHVWSQAVFQHVRDRDAAFTEVLRVLRPGGKFAFDLMTTPRPDVSPEAINVVYQRLRTELGLSFNAYAEVLREHGFLVHETIDLSDQLLANYAAVAALTSEIKPDLSHMYRKMCDAIRDHQTGWAFYLCSKSSGSDDAASTARG